MFKQFFTFIRTYTLFAISVLGALVALGLDIANLQGLAAGLLITLMAGQLLPLLWGIIQKLREGSYGVDVLAAAAIITSVVLQEYWAGMIIVIMLTGGEALEDYAERRARRELDALLQQAPRTARVLRGRKEVTVAASDVRPGDKLVLRAGELVPVDATIVGGTASFDESSLTGESLPQVKKAGDSLLSGSVNLDGSLTVQALHSAADSQYEQIIKLVRSAQKSKAPFVRMADRYAIPFTIISFGIAGMAWAFSGDAMRFLQVLVVATPCPLILAAPIAIISGMSRAAKHGIIVKTGSAMEQLADAKTFAFDKTGTLTEGRLSIARIKAFKGYTQTDVISYAAALEQHSNHVLAAAIIAKAKKDGVKFANTKNVREVAGSGLLATAGGKQVVVGRFAILEEYGVALPAVFDPKAVQTTAAFVAVNKQLIGYITFTDTVRKDAKSTIARLKQLGVRDTLMVTGDHTAAAQAVGKQLEISEVRAEALPADKILAMEAVTDRPVAFVGDGVNDAPVLTASDVGIALGARGSAAASESADVVIMLDDFSRVAESRAIARHTFSIARQSIFIGIGLSLALMAIFATGKFKPIYGAAIQELVDVVVILNALRAHGSWKRSKTPRSIPKSKS